MANYISTFKHTDNIFELIESTRVQGEMIELLVSPLVKKFDDFIRQERTFLGEKSERLQSLRNSLEQLMLCSVKRVKKGEHEDGGHLEDLVDHVCKVEDFIDKLIFEFGKSRSDSKFSRERGKYSINIATSLHNFVNSKNFPQMDSDVVSLKTKLDEFHNKKEILVQINSFETWKLINSFETLKPLQNKPVDPTLSLGMADHFIIGVVGISSSAKTAMVQDMLDSRKEYFEKHISAWVQVSEYHEIHNLLMAVIKAFKLQDKELDMMGTEKLGLYLYESLIECPYLLVLEDLSDQEVWAQLRRALPDNKLGSKVFITTRIRSLIEKSGEERAHIYELPVENFTIPEICTIFNSSFDDLHHLLKLCYLYLGLFPENSEIKVDKLIKLWVAEGFIKSGKGGTLEEVAMDYVNELADRSLIKVAKRNVTRIDTFQVDPCLTALIVSKSGVLKLLQLLCPLENPSQNPSHITDRIRIRILPRRFASHFGFRKDFTTDHLARTLMVFSRKDDTVAKVSKVEPCGKLRLLQVLDLEGTWFPASRETGKTTLPNAINNLILLRYLGLNDTYIDDIPPFIKNLQALQTLYVDREILVTIPNEINELKQLRHLYGRLKWPFKVNNLSQLQTLGHVEIIWRFSLNTDLVTLKELYVVFTKEVYISNIRAISKLTNLQTLYIKINNLGDVDLSLLSNSRNLLQLKLKGEITELPPNMHEIFPKLKYLYISHYNKKTPLPLEKLANLPELTILDLYHLSIDEKVKAGSFPQLEILQLFSCKFEASSFDDTTMPHLKELRTDRNDDNIPKRLKSLPEPKHWGRCRDDDWPYFPRTTP